MSVEKSCSLISSCGPHNSTSALDVELLCLGYLGSLILFIVIRAECACSAACSTPGGCCFYKIQFPILGGKLLIPFGESKTRMWNLLRAGNET